MFCRKCGKKLLDNAEFCPACSTPIPKTTIPAKPKGKYKIVLSVLVCVTVAIAVAIIISSIKNARCDYSGCTDKKEYGNYCSYHVCTYGDCLDGKAYGSDYCYYHKGLVAAAESVSAANAEEDLYFTNIQIEHNSSYTVATGKVTNRGRATYCFVKIKGSFKSSGGLTVDTDWTYAVGSEGLAPGESTTFRLSVPKDRSISRCSISILDYDT